MPETPFFLWHPMLVALGAVSGSCARHYLIIELEKIFPYKHWSTFAVNLTASFSFGLLNSWEVFNTLEIEDSPLILFLGIGFLGGLSTFSTFIVELLANLENHRYRQFIYLAACSIVGGLAATFLGYWLGNI